MEQTPRHQCLIYEGATTRHLTTLVAEIRRKLMQNYRRLYFNGGPVVARLQSSLAAANVDVACDQERSSLILSSELKHLDKGGSFNVGRMVQRLSDALDQALSAGYDGLWVSGDMAWEFGPEKDFSKLLEYEWRLEELFCQRSELIGICQYHANTLPREAMHKGFIVHPALFVSETLSIHNPYYREPEVFTEEPGKNPEVESVLDQFYRRIGFN
jgi:hypothetical protein